MSVEELTLKPVPPFSFDLSGKIFSEGDKQIRVYENGKFRQVIRVNEKLVLVTLESQGTVDEPKVKAILESASPLQSNEKSEAKKILYRLFNLDLDLAEFYSLSKKDEVLSRIVNQLYGLRSPTTQTVYEALVDSIIEQQISLNAATSMERKVIKKFGESAKFGNEIYYAYPTPKSLSKATIRNLTHSGLSRRKAEFIKEISSQIVEGKLNLECFRNKETPIVVQELDNLRGIGLWTAELTVIRSMQKWDAIPADDLGLRRIISHFYCGGEKITSEQTRRIANPWGKWRGLAAYYFVVAELIGVER